MDMQTKRMVDGDRTNLHLGRGLGLFSIGLGITQIAAADQLAKWLGVERRGEAVPILRALGAREALTGIGLLAKPQAAVGPWARMIGDGVSLALLGWVLGGRRVMEGGRRMMDGGRRVIEGRRVRRRNAMIAVGAVAGLMLLDAFVALRRRRMFFREPIRRTITIDRAPHEVYSLWRDVERAPEFMSWVESVQSLGDGRSHWKVRTPAGKTVEFDSEIVEDIPGQRIAWRSVPGAKVPHRGQVIFAPAIGGRGTDVFLDMQGTAPLAKTLGSTKAKQDLANLKTLLESSGGAGVPIR